MALLDAEDKQALKELAFGATEKIKDKVWRAILLIGLAIILVIGIITYVLNRDSLRDVWLLVGICLADLGLITVILSLRIFRTMHAQLRKILFPITILCCLFVLFAIFVPVYQTELDTPQQCIKAPCPQTRALKWSFTGIRTDL